MFDYEISWDFIKKVYKKLYWKDNNYLKNKTVMYKR